MENWGGEIRRISVHKNRDQTLKNAYTKSAYTKSTYTKKSGQTLNAYTKISVH